MKKDEDISKYGEQAWKTKLDWRNKNRRKVKEKPNEWSIKIDCPAPVAAEDEEERNIADDIASTLQKQIRKEWARKYNKQHIIIVEAGAMRKKTSLKYIFELYQLNLTDEEIKDFERICGDELKNVLSDFGN